MHVTDSEEQRERYKGLWDMGMHGMLKIIILSYNLPPANPLLPHITINVNVNVVISQQKCSCSHFNLHGVLHSDKV